MKKYVNKIILKEIKLQIEPVLCFRSVYPDGGSACFSGSLTKETKQTDFHVKGKTESVRLEMKGPKSLQKRRAERTKPKKGEADLLEPWSTFNLVFLYLSVIKDLK